MLTYLSAREREWAANQFGAGCRTYEDVERAEIERYQRVERLLVRQRELTADERDGGARFEGQQNTGLDY